MVREVKNNFQEIVRAVEAVLGHFRQTIHPTMGPLLTRETEDAWTNLKQHVINGCLCDPPNVTLQCWGDPVVIGGETFRSVVTKRGASALEGFHAHQKQWFGPFATFAAEAGNALLADGALRWNRKRRNQAEDEEGAIPCVFERDLLHSVDALHEQLTGRRLYHNLIRKGDAATTAIASQVP